MTNQPKREYVEAPAGHGKTEAIALEVEKNASNKEVLVLTHTNAGVNTLKKRFKKKNTPSKSYDIYTIDAFCLRFSQFYPSVSGVSKKNDSINGDTYRKARDGAIKIFDFSDLKNFLVQKYSCLLVDEYQDCSMSQHHLVLKLSENLDCLVFGDPMQGIFDFDSGGFSWQQDLCLVFQENEEIKLDTPHRWINHGTSELGVWIQAIREKLKNGRKNEISSLNIPKEVISIRSTTNTGSVDFERIIATEICKIIPDSGTVLILVNGGQERPNLRHSIAKNMYCSLQSIETLDSPKLIGFLKNIDSFLRGYRRSPVSLFNLIRDYAKSCMTGTPSLQTSLKSKLSKYPQKSISELRELGSRLREDNKMIYNLLLDIYETKNSDMSVKIIQKLIKFIESKSRKMFRKELWYSLKEAIKMQQRDESKTLQECGLKIRQKTSFIGRSFTRIIGTTLLTKGLEFEHVIIVDPVSFDDKNLYVALSRACKSISIINLK